MTKVRQGLDYFPLGTDTINNRKLRRVMKREGDEAFTVYMLLLSLIYSDEGYFVKTDDEFCEEIADRLFSTDCDKVARVIAQLIDLGVFDAGLHERYGILTSEEIQRQYKLIMRRRKCVIRAEYNLIPADEVENTEDTARPAAETVATGAKSRRAVTETPPLATETAVDTASAPRDDHKENKRKEKGKENLLPNPPRQGGDGETAEYPHDTAVAASRGRYTQDDIDRMQPPADNVSRNFSGLLENLRLFRVPPAEQYAIVKLSNYGMIGGVVWKGISNLRDSGGKIRLPGRYLLSLMG
jgi:hypothetical protein